jgi:hypothetical protein
MPDSRSHRGPDPHDDTAFCPASEPALRAAVSDLSWLLSKGYAVVSALKLVGDRWNLTARQRQAVWRSACSDEARSRRKACQVKPSQIAGRALMIDGFNVLTTIEAALGGAVVLHCRDSTYRDIAGVHGSYRRVAETLPAIAKLAAALERLQPRPILWLFDRPVSNSGRIRSVVLETAALHGWEWTVELLNDPDGQLKRSSDLVATSDSAILDCGPAWLNLARIVIDTECPEARVVDLSEPGDPEGRT